MPNLHVVIPVDFDGPETWDLPQQVLLEDSVRP